MIDCHGEVSDDGSGNTKYIGEYILAEIYSPIAKFFVS